MSMFVCLPVRLSVCLSVLQDISGTIRAIFTNSSVRVANAVAQSSSGRVTKSLGEGAILGFFLPIDNAL